MDGCCDEPGQGKERSDAVRPPRALTPTLSQPPPIRREREPLPGSCLTRAPSPGWGVEGWERVGVRVRAAKPPGREAGGRLRVSLPARFELPEQEHRAHDPQGDR